MSDSYEVDLCQRCGSVRGKPTKCGVCGEKVFQKTSIPYACKLLFQNLQALGIKLKMFPDV